MKMYRDNKLLIASGCDSMYKENDGQVTFQAEIHDDGHEAKNLFRRKISVIISDMFEHWKTPVLSRSTNANTIVQRTMPPPWALVQRNP